MMYMFIALIVVAGFGAMALLIYIIKGVRHFRAMQREN
jgi:hypothetical protein